MCDTHEQTEAAGAGEYPSFEECVAFHGHTCPGLATGYRAAVTAMQALDVARPYDEELVAIAETDACGVDAIQMVTGCTAGKGNLVIQDHGKHVFTFISRESERAVRVLVRHHDNPDHSEMNELRKKIFSGRADPADHERFHELMHAAAERILTAALDEVLEIRDVDAEPPARARIFASVVCACCGEQVADAKTRMLDGRQVCIPCHEAARLSGHEEAG
ncbi:MAG TPA: formylmethanofuran dehydrogenase [Methanoculleus sp.]|nr:formylmethanofuran dehydrogenase [Methanoculleus sp.]